MRVWANLTFPLMFENQWTKKFKLEKAGKILLGTYLSLWTGTALQLRQTMIVILVDMIPAICPIMYKKLVVTRLDEQVLRVGWRDWWKTRPRKINLWLAVPRSQRRRHSWLQRTLEQEFQLYPSYYRNHVDCLYFEKEIGTEFPKDVQLLETRIGILKLRDRISVWTGEWPVQCNQAWDLKLSCQMGLLSRRDSWIDSDLVRRHSRVMPT